MVHNANDIEKMFAKDDGIHANVKEINHEYERDNDKNVDDDNNDKNYDNKIGFFLKMMIKKMVSIKMIVIIPKNKDDYLR